MTLPLCESTARIPQRACLYSKRFMTASSWAARSSPARQGSTETQRTQRREKQVTGRGAERMVMVNLLLLLFFCVFCVSVVRPSSSPNRRRVPVVARQRQAAGTAVRGLQQQGLVVRQQPQAEAQRRGRQVHAVDPIRHLVGQPLRLVGPRLQPADPVPQR